MNNKEQLLFNLLNSIIKNDYNNMNIGFALIKKEPGKLDLLKCMAVDSIDKEKGIMITMNLEEIDISPIHEWDFSIDDNVFAELEDGYEIKYMPLETHFGMWYVLNNHRDEINHTEGMQKYLSYCVKNEITSKVISQIGHEFIDIMDLRKECNNGYEIIADMNIGSNAIVLGYKKSAPSPYVTWSTTKNRQYGYEIGHYFKSKNDAFHDFESRCNALYKATLERNRNKLFQKKEQSHER